MFSRRNKKHEDLFSFFLKTMMCSVAVFLMASTFVLAFISQDIGARAYSNNNYFSQGGAIIATSTRLAISGQAVSLDSNAAYGVYGYSFTNKYIKKDEQGVVGDAIGIYGDARASNGYPTSGGNVYGVWGNARVDSELRANATGVYGKIADEKGLARKAFGLRGEVYDRTGAGEGNYYGVYGLYKGDGIGFGVYGDVSGAGFNAAAIYGRGEDNNYAGYFDGRVKVKGDLVLESSNKKNSNICSTEGSIYYNSAIRELCFCNGANWMKVSDTLELCK